MYHCKHTFQAKTQQIITQERRLILLSLRGYNITSDCNLPR